MRPGPPAPQVSEDLRAIVGEGGGGWISPDPIEGLLLLHQLPHTCLHQRLHAQHTGGNHWVDVRFPSAPSLYDRVEVFRFAGEHSPARGVEIGVTDIGTGV